MNQSSSTGHFLQVTCIYVIDVRIEVIVILRCVYGLHTIGFAHWNWAAVAGVKLQSIAMSPVPQL